MVRRIVRSGSRRASPARLRAAAALLSLAFIVSCDGSESGVAVEAASPAGVAVATYDFVPPRQRVDEIEWVDDLFIAERGADLEYAFGRAVPRVATDGQGFIYALDPSYHRVQVFSAEGEFVHGFGNRGQGPCEFDLESGRRSRAPTPFSFAGDRLLIAGRLGRVSLWGRDGDCVAELEQEDPDLSLFWRVAEGVDKNRVVVFLHARDSYNPAQGSFVVSLLEIDGELLVEQRRLEQGVLNSERADIAVDPAGTVYVARRDADRALQRLTAFALDGERRWAVEMPWLRDWNGFATLKVDGHGHLYVFLGNRWQPRDDLPPRRLVDVYSPAGERIFTGTMPGLAEGSAWQDADGDFVYGVDQDPDTFEWRIIRSRLVEPFR